MLQNFILITHTHTQINKYIYMNMLTNYKLIYIIKYFQNYKLLHNIY